MSIDHPFKSSQEVVDFFKENFKPNDEHALEELMWQLRRKECSQMQTVFLLIEEGRLSFDEANRTVLNSKTWNSPGL